MKQPQTCPLVSRLLDPMRYPECKSTELCVCPCAITDPGKMYFPSTDHVKASITLKMQHFLWGKRQNNWVIFGLLDSQAHELSCAPCCRNIPISVMGQNPPLYSRRSPVDSSSTYTAPMMLGHHWGPQEMSHSQTSEADVLRGWWEQGSAPLCKNMDLTSWLWSGYQQNGFYP